MPILIGVIVLGFVIGAGLSLSGRHDTVVALASPSPALHETFVPVTPAPSEAPTPQPTAAPTARERASAAKVTEPAASVPATSVPATAKPQTAVATAAPTPIAATHRLAVTPATPRRVAAEADSTAPLAPAEPRVTTVPTEAAGSSVAVPATHAAIPPATAATATATAAPAAVPATQPSVVAPQGDPAFTRLSAAVVRQFLESVKRGDQASAFAVLASPPASEQELAEYGVVDARTSVGRIDAHGAANNDAFVSVQMDTPNGPYFGQYTVHKSDTGAAVIVAHSIVKP